MYLLTYCVCIYSPHPHISLFHDTSSSPAVSPNRESKVWSQNRKQTRVEGISWRPSGWVCFATQRTWVQSLVSGQRFPHARGNWAWELQLLSLRAPEPECAGRASQERKGRRGDGGTRPESLPCESSSPWADVLWGRLAGQRWAPGKRRPFFSECFFSSELVLVNVVSQEFILR